MNEQRPKKKLVSLLLLGADYTDNYSEDHEQGKVFYPDECSQVEKINSSTSDA